MTADEKITEYLERAWDILDKSKVARKFDLGNTATLQIAKMLQIEEHKTELQEYGLNVNSKNEY